MRDESQPISWRISCKLPDDLQRAESIARKEVAPEKIFEDVARTGPRGVEKVTTTYHRMGDYFKSVQIRHDDEQTAFSLTFYPFPNAGRYWKDLMADALRAIRDSAQGVSIRPAERAR
jgi:hypothetical protein